MTFSIKTSKNKEIVDITGDLEKILQKGKFEDGICNIHLTHTTCAVTTADLDPGTDKDLSDAFSAMIPQLQWRHPHDPSHTPDHIASALIGTSISVPFENKKLILGTWQRIVLAEFAGPRERQIVVTVLS